MTFDVWLAMKSIDEEIFDQLNILERLCDKKAITKEESYEITKTREKIEKLCKIKIFLDKNGFKHVNDAKNNSTPLISAIKQSNMEIFDLLLRHPKIDVNQHNDKNETPVYICANEGKIEFLHKLAARNADFSKANADLLYASAMSKISRAPAFITHKMTGLNIYDDSEYGVHPLHALCKSLRRDDETLEIFELMKNNNVDLNARDENMDTPLMAAARYGNLMAIKWLIENGADVTAVDRFNFTFLELVSKTVNRNAVLQILQDNNLNTNWFKDVDTVKEYGHVLGIGFFLKLGNSLGLGGIIPVPLGKKDETVSVYTEGWGGKKSRKALEIELKKYIERENLINTDFNVIHDAMNLLTSTQTQSPGDRQEKWYAAYRENKPVVLPISTTGHGLGLAIYKDKLILTDRFLPTGGRIDECTKIFNLKSTDEATIKNLLSQFTQGSFDSIDDITEVIQKVVDYDNPILLTGDKLQMHGTCSYSNPRSNVEGLLCVMQADRLSGSKEKILEKSVIACKQSAHDAYRKFLYSGRYHKARDLIKDMNDAENRGKIPRANMFYHIAESYIKSHQSLSKNDGTDWKNTQELYQGLPERLKKKFNAENPSLASKIESSLVSVRIQSLIEKNKNSKSNPKIEIMSEILHQCKVQSEGPHPLDLSDAIKAVHQLSKNGGYESVFKEELPKVIALLEKDKKIPKIDLPEFDLKTQSKQRSRKFLGVALDKFVKREKKLSTLEEKSQKSEVKEKVVDKDKDKESVSQVNKP